MISVLILTKNEEKDLPDCIKSVSWSDDINVFDSYSDDRTKEIALSFGANLIQRRFDGYASQRNAALKMTKFKHQWILILDADERIPEDLAVEMQVAISSTEQDVNGFRIRRRDYLENTWLRFSQISPFYIRLVRREKAEYHREINEVLEVEGKVGQLKEYFNHYPFSKGYKHWLEKHNLYSSMEAQRWIEEQNGKYDFSLRKALFSKDFSEKRFHQKGIFYKLPGRPLIKWFYMILFRGAFLDGRAGLIYATLQSIYEFFIVIKTNELMKISKTK